VRVANFTSVINFLEGPGVPASRRAKEFVIFVNFWLRRVPPRVVRTGLMSLPSYLSYFFLAARGVLDLPDSIYVSNTLY
jgi:hypothetical protein